MYNIFLDFGHGGKDSGAIGHGLKEKDRALTIGLKIGKILERHKVKVRYSRQTDVFIELATRSDLSNLAKSDLFVSIHLNAHHDKNAQGFEIFNYPKSTSGLLLAKDIHDSVIHSKLFTKDRGIKQANFSVLRRTKAKAVLIEVGFITNKEDVQLMGNREDEFAQVIAKGILANLGIPLNINRVETNSEWAINWERATREKVIDGTRPKEFATREEVIEMLYRKGQ